MTAAGWRSVLDARMRPARRAIAKAIAALCITATVGTLAVELPRAIGRLGERADRAASLNFDDREFATGNSILPDKQLLYEARALIPHFGTFRVATGAGPVKGATDLTVPYAATFATYFLMPRRPSDRSHWVICVGCDVAKTGPNPRVVWTDGSGSSLIRLSR